MMRQLRPNEFPEVYLYSGMKMSTALFGVSVLVIVGYSEGDEN